MNTMDFILDVSTELGGEQLRAEIAELLLAGNKVLWLVSGGSNIQISTQVMDSLGAVANQNLTVMLMDERYGEVGHAASNWRQLEQAGFTFDKVRAVPILETGVTREETTAAFARRAEQEFKMADVIIGQFGMGKDGHVAGILPYSPATADGQIWAVDYEGGAYQRITLSFFALAQIHIAYAFIYGADKKPALARLKNENLGLAEQPAQILKAIERVCVYNDQID